MRPFTVIDLLDRLGSERDEDVLEAARTLHAKIEESAVSWEDLLVGDETPEPEEPKFDDTEDDTDEEDDIAAPTADIAVNESETEKLINKLLAREGNSEDFREELEGYKTDLANGDFEPSDHHYVHALYARLMKNN